MRIISCDNLYFMRRNDILGLGVTKWYPGQYGM